MPARPGPSGTHHGSPMYLLSILLLLVVLPIAFVPGEKLLFASALGWIPLIGKWFVFSGAMQLQEGRPEW